MIQVHPHACHYSDLDVQCDATITDPPYGGRTHKGHDAGGPQIKSATGQATRRALTYAPWTADDVRNFVDYWAPRTRGWMACYTSDDLIDAYKEAYQRHNRYAFAPVSVIQKRPRLLGDGPSSWTLYVMASRPATREWQKWRCLPGSYNSKIERGAPLVGAKPVSLMREIVRDYSNPGQLVCDPCAGWGSTLIAAHELGRDAYGGDCDPEIHAALVSRVGKELAA
jgi:site-specific DNA-methyltransferase (adenine-specific)